jgi:hypothetical protein
MEQERTAIERDLLPEKVLKTRVAKPRGKPPGLLKGISCRRKGVADELGRGILVEQLQRWIKRRLASKDKKAKGEINRDFLDNTKKMCIFANSI